MKYLILPFLLAFLMNGCSTIDAIHKKTLPGGAVLKEGGRIQSFTLINEFYPQKPCWYQIRRCSEGKFIANDNKFSAELVFFDSGDVTERIKQFCSARSSLSMEGRKDGLITTLNISNNPIIAVRKCYYNKSNTALWVLFMHSKNRVLLTHSTEEIAIKLVNKLISIEDDLFLPDLP